MKPWLSLVVALVPSVGFAAPGDPMPVEETFEPLPPHPGIRVVSAPQIREVSAARAPMRSPTPPQVPSLGELRKLVGTTVKDVRDPALVALGWARSIHTTSIAAASGPRLVAWARATQRLAAPAEAAPGDLLVFDRTDGDEADLVAIVVERDERGVLEFIYQGGVVVRRGFADPARPSLARDGVGNVVNTFLRHGRRQPPKGTRYLAGELLVHCVHLGP
ncbi:MAG: hypothetical protein KF773_18465 [Deltaproteobacteria bacterium]|nr:hypothetical protein [Deltaproteobacteria bacterium]